MGSVACHMRILGLDPSLTNYGWAIYDTEAPRELLCEARGRFRTKASMLFIDRYKHMRASLSRLIRKHQPDRVGIEFPVFGELWSEGMYGLFLFSMEAIQQEGRDVVLWTPMQGKAFARELLGRPKGWRMEKGDMVEAARFHTRRSDLELGPMWNHNEADAFMMAALSARFWLFYDGSLTESDLTPVETKYFTEIKRFVRGKKAGKEIKRGMIFREDDRFFLWSGDTDGEGN